jgi:hypothetical protein
MLTSDQMDKNERWHQYCVIECEICQVYLSGEVQQMDEIYDIPFKDST